MGLVAQSFVTDENEGVLTGDSDASSLDDSVDGNSADENRRGSRGRGLEEKAESAFVSVVLEDLGEAQRVDERSGLKDA